MSRLLAHLSFRGRTNRARFWLTSLVIYAVLIAASVLAVVLDNLTPFFAILFLPVFLATLVASLANGVRRLHDRGKSAWWLILFVGIPLVLLLPADVTRDSADPDASGLAALCALASLPFSIWCFVEMGCLRGTVGPNRFGEDPLAAVREEADQALA